MKKSKNTAQDIAATILKMIGYSILVVMFIVASFALTSCKKSEAKPCPEQPAQTPLPQQTGSAIFYYDGPVSTPSVTVMIGAQVANITVLSSTTPSCGASGCATFIMLPGTYTWSASDNTPSQWSGTITVTQGGCSAQILQ